MSTQLYKNSQPEFIEANLVQCVYNPSHQIDPNRLIVHLVRCRKAILDDVRSPYYEKAKQMEICKFNEKHHIPKTKMRQHLETCESRSQLYLQLQQDTYEDVPEWKKHFEQAQTQKAMAMPDEEDWDDEECQGNGYDPMKKIAEQKGVRHNIQGKKPAEKKQYRAAVKRAAAAADVEALLPVGRINSFGEATQSTNTKNNSKKESEDELDDFADAAGDESKATEPSKPVTPEPPRQEPTLPLGRGRGMKTQSPRQTPPQPEIPFGRGRGIGRGANRTAMELRRPFEVVPAAPPGFGRGSFSTTRPPPGFATPAPPPAVNAWGRGSASPGSGGDPPVANAWGRGAGSPTNEPTSQAGAPAWGVDPNAPGSGGKPPWGTPNGTDLQAASDEFPDLTASFSKLRAAARK